MKYINTFKLFEVRAKNPMISRDDTDHEAHIANYNTQQLDKLTLARDSDADKLLQLLKLATGKNPITTRKLKKEIKTITKTLEDKTLASRANAYIFNAAEQHQHYEKAKADLKPKKEVAKAFWYKGLDIISQIKS